MNKSKFLKKSLAMLLALMLVFAMIPLSASATEGEYGSDPVVTVNTDEAALTGDTYAVTIQSNSTKVTLQGSAPVAAGADGKVVFYDKDGKPITANATVDLEDVATKTGDNEYTLDVKLEIPEEDSEAVEKIPYKLVVTFEKTELNGNPAISALKNIPEDVLASYEIDADTISITTKFGEKITSLTADNFVLAGDKAQVTTAPTLTYNSTTNTTTGSVIVTAEDKTTKTYNIEITMRPGLESFEIEGQVGETKIETVNQPNDDGVYTTRVTVTMPHGTTDTKVYTPTFELGPDVVTLTDVNDYVLTSGVDEHDFADADGNKHLQLWKDATVSGGEVTGGTWSYVFVTINKAPNTASALESIQVVDGNDKSNVINVTAPGTVNVEMPKNYSFGDNTTPKKVDVIVKGSENAKVEVLGQDVDVETITGGTATLEDVNITSKSFKLRVTSEETGATANEYTINLSAATVADTKLYVQAKKADSDTIYEAEFDGEEGVLKLPYAARSHAEADDYTLYFSASTGATIGLLHINSSTSFADPNILTGNLDNLFITHGVDTERVFVVTNPTADSSDTEDNKTTYTLKLDFEDAQTGRTITGGTLVNTNDVPKITPDGTYEISTGTIKLDDAKNTEVNTLRVAVPYTFGNGATVWAKDLQLSEGAVAFTAYNANGGPELKTLDPKVKGPQNAIPNVKVLTDDTVINANDTTLKEDKYDLSKSGSGTIIYVVSEKIYVDEIADATNKWLAVNDLTDKEVTKYYVYGVKAAAQTGAELKSIDSTLDENIDVTMKANNVIEIAVPYSYVNQNKGAWTPFTLNFRTDSMATMKDDLGVVLKSDLGSADTDNATMFGIYDYGTTTAPNPKLVTGTMSGNTFNGAAGSSSQFVVSSESQTNGKPTNTTTYTIQVKVNEAETGSALTSVEAAGSTATIASNRDVNLTLPYGTDKYPVQLDLEASKLATIYVGTPSEENASMKNAAHLYDPEKGYDLNGDVKILVVAEDGESETVYTLKTTVAENFFDVAKDQWYYDEVLKAASNGWINGTKPGYYEPNGTMTRGDFALIIARIKNYNPALYTESAFPDVESTDYYSAAIAYCKEMGYLGGENGYFNPNDPITREEMAKIICNAAGVDQVTDPDSPYADDDTIAEWAKGYVYGCQAAEIMMGDESANTFDARSNATRAEAAAVLVRAFA